MLTNDDMQRRWREFTADSDGETFDKNDLGLESGAALDVAEDSSTFTISEPLAFAVGKRDLVNLMDDNEEFLSREALTALEYRLREQYIASDEAKSTLTVEHADYDDDLRDSYLEISVTVSNERDATVEEVFRDFTNLDALVTNVFDPGSFGHRYIFDVVREDLA